MRSEIENVFLLPKENIKGEKNVPWNIPIPVDDGDGSQILNLPLPKDDVFERYKELSDIAKNIAEEFFKKDQKNKELVYKDVKDISEEKYKDIIEKGQTFFLSSGKRTSGLLSICPATLTALRLWKKVPVAESDLRDRLFKSVETGIKAIFKIIYRDNEQNDNEPIFDASPYESEAFWDMKKSYIDSISWAVPVFLTILNLKDDKDVFVFKDEYREKARFLAKWCLNYINSSLLYEFNEKGEKTDTPSGWNFTKFEYNKAVPSLYFTYAASTVYLSFYDEYKWIIKAQRTIDKFSINYKSEDVDCKSNDGLDSALNHIYNILEKEESQQNDNPIESTDDKKSENTNRLNINEISEIIDELQKENDEKIADFIYFNDGYGMKNEISSVENVGAIDALKFNLEKIAAKIWKNAGDKLEKQFLYEDFNAIEATEDAIKNGGQTNALFTGLLQIGIILNCAYDEKMRREEERKEGGKGKGKRVWEKMQGTMLLHVQKTQRFFNELEDSGKSFGVDSLILRFMEDVSGESIGIKDQELAEKLRSHFPNIRVCSLTPMLLKTNNLLSEYVIRYPQKQMGESLLSISQKRYCEKGKGKNEYHWLWETDNYHAISNYYYVGAIFDFYTYYEKYEQKYVNTYENFVKKLSQQKKYGGQVGKYCKEKDKIIARLAKEKKEYKDTLEQTRVEHANKLKERDNDHEKALKEAKQVSGIGGILVSQIEEIIKNSEYFKSKDFFKGIINGIRGYIASDLVAQYKAYQHEEEQNALESLKIPIVVNNDSIYSLMQALLAEIILYSAIAGKRNDGNMGRVDDGLGQDAIKFFGKDTMSAGYALKGRRSLVEQGKINELLGCMFQFFKWQ